MSDRSDRPPARQTAWPTDRQHDRQTYRQTDTQTHRQTYKTTRAKNTFLGVLIQTLYCFIEDGIIRLAGGDDVLRGRVEIYHDGAWGAVCDTNWDIQDATTVCRQLGFLEASEAKKGSFYGATELPIVMDRVACKGTEPYLSRCSFLCRENNPCTSTAGVVCKPSKKYLLLLLLCFIC